MTTATHNSIPSTGARTPYGSSRRHRHRGIRNYRFYRRGLRI